jgi:NADH-quinone oxidoreductase subunit F
MTEYILLRHRDIANIDELDVYIDNGGFEAFKQVVTGNTPQEIIEIVKLSGLRGRGGAGFPTGVKWSFLTPGVFPRYVVANADESEPGTFKDREIMEHNPFQFLEGVAICCYAAQAETGYVYCRGEFWDLAHRLEGKIAELHERKLLGAGLFGSDFNLDIHIHLGAGAYICGEETALLESMEGKLGQPKSTGPKVFCLSGHVERPGNYELPFGTPFRELIFEHGGGIKDGKAIKAILPAGASAPLLPATDKVLDTPMDYESVPEIGSQLGSASLIILDETVDISWVAYKTSSFFKHESCGKCTPCREGTFWMYNLLKHIKERDAKNGDVKLLDSVARGIKGKCLCALGEFSIMPVISGIEHFREEFDGADHE